MSCLCDALDRASCCGGGLPRTELGECACDCHAATLDERWPLEMPAPSSTGLTPRTRVVEMVLDVQLAQVGIHPQAAVDVCVLLREAPSARDMRAVVVALDAAGLAAPLAGALVRLALLTARARVTAGLLATGGVP